jgi:hypothetical protein
MVYVDRVNPADRAGTTGEQLAESLVAQGAQFIIFNSDDMKEDALNFARNNPKSPSSMPPAMLPGRKVAISRMLPTWAISWAGWNTAR